MIGKDIIQPTEIIDNDGLTSFDPSEDGIDFYESIELMRVAVSNAKVVGPQNYGEVIVVSGDSTILHSTILVELIYPQMITTQNELLLILIMKAILRKQETTIREKSLEYSVLASVTINYGQKNQIFRNLSRI